MELALYDPAHGYYSNRVPGKGSHFTTSASAGPWFGRFVGMELHRMWEALERPDPFTVIEMGAGLGRLAAEAIGSCGELRDALRWRFVEQFDSVKGMQVDTLGPAAEIAEWSSSLEGEPVVGCVLANELLDNFPVHVLERTEGGVEEVFVEVEGDELRAVVRPASDGLVDEALLEAAEALTVGDRFELCPGIGPWCAQAGAVIERGYLLTVDYGDEQPDIWRRGPGGTISTYGPRRLGPDPLQHPGAKDITADVDFSAVWSAAEAAGFRMELLALQRFWLFSLGLPAVVEDLLGQSRDAAAHGRHVEAADLEEEARQVMALADPDGLGGCLVFRASKGFDA